jgi:hypothetical protein
MTKKLSDTVRAIVETKKKSEDVVDVSSEITNEETNVEENTISEAESPQTHPSDAAGASRMAMITDLTRGFASMPKSSQVDFFNQMMATMKSGQFGEKDTAGSNKSSIDTKGDAKSVRTDAMKEDVAELFGDDTLTEEFKEKASTLFEAALAARAVELEVELTEAYEAKLAEEVETMTASLTEEVNKVLNTVLESWYEENRVAIESQLRADIMDEFMVGLKNLFKEHYIEVPDDKVDVVETLSTTVEELEEKLNNTMNENIELKNSLLEVDRQNVFDEVAEGLTVTQSEKFRSLSEGVTFDGDLDAYKRKLDVVKENYFTKTNAKKPVTSQVINEEITEQPNDDEVSIENLDPLMRSYMEATSRVVKK